MSDTKSNQSGALVAGDQAGRDLFKYAITTQKSQVGVWLKKLEAQISENKPDLNKTFIDSLKYFIDQRDGQAAAGLAVGLREKISASKFTISYESALLKKEEFAKLLLKYQEFSSAQELIAYFLSIIYDVFEEKICPIVQDLSYQDFQSIVDTHIVEKIFAEIGEGSGDIFINRNHVRGMIYWLADKCYVRWH